MRTYQGDIHQDLATVSRNHLAERITGGFSNPSKMPELAWGVPATRCRVGAVLATQPGTVCAHCYAAKGRYNFTQVQKKLEERYQGLEHSLWVPAMVLLIRWHVNRFFRWFDSGDLQSGEHLPNVCQVANHTPDILHWLPTREYEIVKAHSGGIPENLVIRISANKLDEDPPPWWPLTSNVINANETPKGHLCPAPDQENFCGPCRACWDKTVGNVSYRLH